jgi:hypothetical protein
MLPPTRGATHRQYSPWGQEKIFKNVIAQQVDLLVEICLPGGTQIFIDVATQL